MARPGQTYFVPGVRIMMLGPLSTGRDDGTELTTLRPDIIKVEVTLVNHGSGQYCITLNNWYDTLPADRRKDASVRGNEIINTTTDQPLWPRWKYNDFQTIQFGNRLRIDMRYWPKPDDDLKESAPDDAMNQDWVPMISGPVSDMRFTFSETEGARVMICGEDDLCCLKNKNGKKVDYWSVAEKDIVDDTIKRSGCPLSLAPPGAPWPTFTESEAKAMAEAHFEGQSYLDYLKHFAERMDMEVFMEQRNLDDVGAGVDFHFEPARSKTKPTQAYRLERGRNLIQFVPDLRVVDQWTRVKLCGKDHSQSSTNQICAEVPQEGAPPPEPLDNELYREATDPPLVSGPEWRRRCFGENPHNEINQRGIDQERANVMADAVYRKRAREFLKVDGETIGLPRIRAGKYVEIRGMRPPFDGFYYCEKTVHTYGPTGLRTRFLARRPGMPFPPYGET